MAPNKVIIDTDPGVDDILALLLALSARPEELQIMLISVTHGNIDVVSCLRNVVALFHTVFKEVQWRKENGLDPGFAGLSHAPPIVAVGAEEPLEDQLIMADFFHGIDGLGGIHTSHPHLSPSESWKSLFNLPSNMSTSSGQPLVDQSHSLFRPSQLPAHKEMLRVLRAEPPDTVTIIAIGPLTNLALAAAADPAAFLRAKEVVVMGGALKLPGNITPLAEFNTHADTIAASRIYALSSPNPASTMPKPLPLSPPLAKTTSQETETHPKQSLGDYPAQLPSRLNVTLFPLDITEEHLLRPASFARLVESRRDRGSPLAAWMSAFMPHAFGKSMEHGSAGLAVHDAVCVWYAMSRALPAWQVARDQDIRVETAGVWTRGACIVDRRGRQRAVDLDDVPGDRGGWLTEAKGNRLGVCTASPGSEAFERTLLGRILAVDVEST